MKRNLNEPISGRWLQAYRAWLYLPLPIVCLFFIGFTLLQAKVPLIGRLIVCLILLVFATFQYLLGKFTERNTDIRAISKRVLLVSIGIIAFVIGLWIVTSKLMYPHKPVNEVFVFGPIWAGPLLPLLIANALVEAKKQSSQRD